MAKFATMSGVLLLVLAASAGAANNTTKAASSAMAMHSVEQNIVNQTNAQRARHGLPPLMVDPALMSSARRHATWMTRSRRLQHTSANVAENIAMGQRSTSEAMNSWMTSSGHRANILNGGYRRIGVAAYTAPCGTTFWCQQFLH